MQTLLDEADKLRADMSAAKAAAAKSSADATADANKKIKGLEAEVKRLVAGLYISVFVSSNFFSLLKHL